MLNISSDTPIVRFEGRDESAYNGQWIEAKYLKVGDKVLLSSGKTDILTKVVTEECEEFTTYNFEVEDFHTYYVGEQGILVHNDCVKSRIHESDALVKEAQKLGIDEQRDVNHLISEFAKGNTNPGTHNKHLINNIRYLRGRSGARVFFSIEDDVMYILGKAAKGNENRVIALVIKIFGGG